MLRAMKKIICLAIACIIFLSLASCKDNDRAEAERKVAEYRAAKFTQYAEENKKYADYEVDVAFIGDSLTDGYDLEKYYPQYVVSNRGIGGETTTGLEERLQLSIFELKPKVVVMLIGANNMDSMLQNYERLITSIKENLPDSRLIILSLTSMGGEWGRKNQLAAYNNVQLKLLAEKHSLEFVDLYSPLLNLEDGEIYDEYTTDGGHLTHEGYVVLTEQITPAIERQLAIWHEASK